MNRLDCDEFYLFYFQTVILGLEIRFLTFVNVTEVGLAVTYGKFDRLQQIPKISFYW
jgi:hypothetical protein